jgi:ketosteroid isomerase-like protein
VISWIVSGKIHDHFHMSSKETVLAFIDRINAHDLDGLAELMTADHCFIDAHGNQVAGKEKMIAGWRGYFEWFPVYSIEVNEIFEREDTFAMFGFAAGSFKGRAAASWRLPAAWKAIVRDRHVALWQVFADTKIPFEIIERQERLNRS